MSEESHEDQALYPPLNPLRTGWKGRCPRCGQGKLFKGFITPVERCSNCGLDMRFSDAGDGPAVFIIMIVGFLIVGAALAVEFTLTPPIWVHMIIWLPLTIILAIGLLRPLKGLMIAQQYKHSAREGRIDE
ncbi:DUF983 domain-containing protein [Rhizobiales bacterium]|uniref:DUF983 domain-containing protein n=1 Tax=Hongsoonwoonella zoysiae TaxID=2821844 RepID=UPI0015612700|nr:DUF983 domain-containing protein [Hongsoonwoonella zoysiae]NRG19795.1 DUF983 domain-containing protein [Hongsoonwoonella zoysiae]